MLIARLFAILIAVVRCFAPLVLRYPLYAIKGATRSKLPAQRAGPLALRLFFETVGGAFIKFGQLLAMRPDLLSEEYILELHKLLDNVPAFPSSQAERAIQQALRTRIGEIFSHFEMEPVAAASFAQVHRATLLNGELVAVKIQRPNLARIVYADTTLVLVFARIVDFLGLMKRVRIRDVAKEFCRWTEEELDLRIEATYAQRLRDSIEGNSSAYVPKVYWEYTTDVVLTLEFLSGVWVTDLLQLISANGYEFASVEVKRKGLDLDLIAKNIFDTELYQMFELSIFHADPHAGNLIVLPENVIGYVDFGICGYMDSEFKSTQLMIYDALQSGDMDGYVRCMYRLLKPPPENADLLSFETEIKQTARRWENTQHNPSAGLRHRSTTWMFLRNLELTRKFGLEVRDTPMRYYRAISVVELIILRLNPNFYTKEALRNYINGLQLRAIERGLSPSEVRRRSVRTLFFMEEAIAVLEQLVRNNSQLRGPIRSRVSGPKLVLSGLFKLFSTLAAVAVFAVPVFRSNLEPLLPFDIGLVPLAFGLGLLMICCAWASRRLYIAAAKTDRLVRK